MVLVNFGHPLTVMQLARIGELTGSAVSRVVAVPTHFDHARSFDEQVRELIATIPLSAEQWQTTPMIVNLPSLAPIAAALLAELHGRCGFFPAVLRLRPLIDTTPPQFETAEVLNLQAIRDRARAKR